MHVPTHTEPCRDFLGQECLDHLQECGKENSRAYSHGRRRVSNSSRPQGTVAKSHEVLTSHSSVHYTKAHVLFEPYTLKQVGQINFYKIILEDGKGQYLISSGINCWSRLQYKLFPVMLVLWCFPIYYKLRLNKL